MEGEHRALTSVTVHRMRSAPGSASLASDANLVHDDLRVTPNVREATGSVRRSAARRLLLGSAERKVDVMTTDAMPTPTPTPALLAQRPTRNDMPCISADGTLTMHARTVLAAFQSAQTPEDVAFATDVSLFRIRSSLRELVAAALLEQVGEAYQITTGAKRLLAEPTA